MTLPRSEKRRGRRAKATIALMVAALAGCGGSGGGASDPPAAAGGGAIGTTPAAPSSTDYPHSLVLGLDTMQDVVYVPATSTATQASVTTTPATTLLRTGVTPVLAEHVDAALLGLREICVSGNGQSTNVVTNINPGVIAESAAVLLDTRWSATDSVAAWSIEASTGGTLIGWENCGVKPEGSPSPSSRLMPSTDRSYSEDVYNGNPGTTFITITQRVPASTVAQMLSTAGYLTTADPTRPLTLKLRAYIDTSGHTIFVETGIPAPNAPSTTRGFIAFYSRTTG